MPSGFSINTSVATVGTDGNKWLDGISVGTGMISTDANGSPMPVGVVPHDGTHLMLVTRNAGGHGTQPVRWGAGSDTTFAITANTDARITFIAEIPIN
jgi:hypothetical protein